MSALLACVEHATTAAPTNPGSGFIAFTVGIGTLALGIYGAGFLALVRTARASRS